MIVKIKDKLRGNIEEITKINGINTELARKIKEKLD